MSDAPVSVVTGANSGIGRATAIYLAQQGHTVYGTVRATSRMDTFHKMAEAAGVEIELVELDVAEDDSVAQGFAEILDDGRPRRRAREQRRRRRQRGRRGGDARDVPRRHERQPVRRHPLPEARAARDARAPQRGDRQHHVAHRQGGGDRPVALRRVEVRVRGRQRRPRPGARPVRHPGRRHRARRHEVGDLRQERRRAERHRRLRRPVPADVPVLRPRHRRGHRPGGGRPGHPPRHHDRPAASCATR